MLHAQLLAICILSVIAAYAEDDVVQSVEYRLPQTVLPEYYKLNLFTHGIDGGFKFSGNISILVSPQSHAFIRIQPFFVLSWASADN